MEVAPQYWQSPETLKDICVSTAGGTVSGTQSTNAVAGTVTSLRPPPAARPRHRDRHRAQRRHQQHRQLRPRSASTGSADSTATETMMVRSLPSAVTRRAIRRSRSTTRAPSSPPRSRSTRAGASLERCHARDQPGAERDRHAEHHPRQLPGDGAHLRGVPRERAGADRSRLCGGLHRAGGALRELHPPDHDPLDPALRGGRRGAGAAACSGTPSSASSPSSA
jgi:hypothetical protein